MQSQLHLDMHKKRFSCSGCSTQFAHKTNAKTHLKRKIPCCNTPQNLLEIIETLYTTCPYCFKQIKTEASINFMGLHLETCGNKSKAESSNNVTTTTTPAVTQGQPNVPNTYIQNNIQNNYSSHLNAWDAPSIDHIEYDPELIVDRPRLLKMAYFDPNFPENHSIIHDPIKDTIRYYYNNNTYKEISDRDDPNYSKLTTRIDEIQNYLIDKTFVDRNKWEAESNRVSKICRESPQNIIQLASKVVKDMSKMVVQSYNNNDQNKNKINFYITDE